MAGNLAARIAQAALAASLGLDADRSVLCFDMVLASLSEAARNSLQAMDPTNYEFQSEFAKHYLSRGRAEGRVEGEATLLSKLLTLKFGPFDDATAQRLQAASSNELERWAERVLTASSLDDVLR